jgi:hypothetical protein
VEDVGRLQLASMVDSRRFGIVPFVFHSISAR